MLSKQVFWSYHIPVLVARRKLVKSPLWLDNVSTQAATDTADMKKRYIAGLDGFEREFKRLKSMV